MNGQRETKRGTQPPSIVAQQAQPQAHEQVPGAGSCWHLRFSWGGWGFQHGRGFSGVCSTSHTVGGCGRLRSPAAAAR